MREFKSKRHTDPGLTCSILLDWVLVRGLSLVLSQTRGKEIIKGMVPIHLLSPLRSCQIMKAVQHPDKSRSAAPDITFPPHSENLWHLGNQSWQWSFSPLPHPMIYIFCLWFSLSCSLCDSPAFPHSPSAFHAISLDECSWLLMTNEYFSFRTQLGSMHSQLENQ